MRSRTSAGASVRTGPGCTLRDSELIMTGSELARGVPQFATRHNPWPTSEVEEHARCELKILAHKRGFEVLFAHLVLAEQERGSR